MATTKHILKFGSLGNPVKLDILTNSKLNEILSKYKYSNTLDPNHIYSDDYVKQQGWQVPMFTCNPI
ncbi:hypothetical protein [Oceanobacillus kapialis]|uniref:hypothetical protein n=1 Tax=Oceanobacillus kapialis TaxID=481353 RepID=UPI00384CCD5A